MHLKTQSLTLALAIALASAAAFFAGGILPVLLVIFVPHEQIAVSVVATSLASLAFLGVLSARVGGAAMVTAAVRVLFWGSLAMTLTYGVGALIGTPV